MLQNIRREQVLRNNLTGNEIEDNTVESEDIKDGTIADIDISNNANINTTKINWNTLTRKQAIDNVLKQDYAPYFQNYDLVTANTYTTLQNTAYSLIQCIYIPYPIAINYFTYILINGASNSRSRVAVWNSELDLIIDSGNQSAAAATYKLNLSSEVVMLPGFYYFAFMSNSTSTRFLSNATNSYAVIPYRGTLYTSYYGNIPSVLDLSNINTTANKQPWFLLS